jgi:hypothetical protein
VTVLPLAIPSCVCHSPNNVVATVVPPGATGACCIRLEDAAADLDEACVHVLHRHAYHQRTWTHAATGTRGN